MLNVRMSDADKLGYLHYTEYPHGTNAALLPLLYTCALVTGLDTTGYRDRWCYQDAVSALAALAAWDGVGEPMGWHRHPATGRRRPAGNAAREYIQL